MEGLYEIERMGGEKRVTLPENWRTLSSAKLVLEYQRLAFREEDMKAVSLIREEMRKRLKVSDLVKIESLGWVKARRLNDGLREGMIREELDGSFTVMVPSIEEYSKGGEVTGRKADVSRFKEWLKY